MGEDTDDFVGVSETPEGLQKRTGNALQCTRKWRVTANVKKCAVVVYNDGKETAKKVLGYTQVRQMIQKC